MKRRIWPLGVFCVLTLLLIWGISEIFTQARINVLMVRLPSAPTAIPAGEVLREKIHTAHINVRNTLDVRGPGRHFGQAVGALGKVYQANHFYDRALSCYRLAREYDPSSALWFYLSASIHQQRGKTESMIGLLKRTLSLSDHYSPAVLKLADTYFKIDEKEKAKAHYQHRLKLVPGDPYALMGLARIAMDAARWDRAETLLNKAISSDSHFGDAHRLMAEVHEHNGRMKEQKESLDLAAQCARFHPAPDPWVDGLRALCYDPEKLLVLGSMALSELNIDAAINKHFARALEIDPKNPEAHLAMGKAWFMAGEWSRARQYLSHALKLDPTSGQAYFHLGLILRANHQLQEAETMLIKALDVQPNNANVHNNLGVLLLEQGRYAEAIQSLEKALDIYPEHINARYNLGMSLWASGNSKGAVSQYRRVLGMKPEWKGAANALAWILATDSDPDVRDGHDAVKWAQVALAGEQNPNPEHLDTLAAAYAEAGQYERAIDAAQEALALARKGEDKHLASDIESHLRCYELDRPFHE